MELLIDIPDEVGNEIRNSGKFCYEDRFNGKTLVAYMHRAIKEGVVLPNNATNGEVIKAMFPNVKTIGHPIKTENDSIRNHAIGEEILRCSDSWWNAPYKAESEDKE